jgi:hypothetical protein
MNIKRITNEEFEEVLTAVKDALVSINKEGIIFEDMSEILLTCLAEGMASMFVTQRIIEPHRREDAKQYVLKMFEKIWERTNDLLDKNYEKLCERADKLLDDVNENEEKGGQTYNVPSSKDWESKDLSSEQRESLELILKSDATSTKTKQ